MYWEILNRSIGRSYTDVGILIYFLYNSDQKILLQTNALMRAGMAECVLLLVDRIAF